MAEKKRRRFPLWSRLLLAGGAAVLMLALTAVGLRYWITSDMGRGFIVSMLNRQRIPGLGVIRVSELKGDPLTAASLADLALVDDNGPWLRASDVRLEWDATKLLSGQLDIKAIDVGAVHVLRRPVTERQSQRPNASSEAEFSLGRLTVKELKLEPDVLGPAAAYTVTGAATRARDLSGHAELLLAPISGPGDRIDATARWTATGELTAKIDAAGLSGGAIATLIQAPPGAEVALTGNATGAITRFTADLRLALAGVETATVHVTRNGAAADLAAELHAGTWPLFDIVTARTGADFALTAQADLVDGKPIPVTARLVAPAGRIDATLRYNAGAGFPLDAVHIEAADIDLARVTGKQLAGRLTARGDVTFGALLTPDWQWAGDSAIDALDFPNGHAQRATMKLTVSQRGDAYAWAASRGEATGVRLDALKDLKPARYEFSSTGDVKLKTRMVSISRVQIRGDALSAAANGRYAITTGALKLEGLADMARLSDVSPFAGTARGNWSVERASQTAPWRIAASAAGRNVGSSDAILARLAGPNPTVKLSALFSDGRFSIESGEFRGDGLEAHMTGRIDDDGRISAHAMGRLRRPLDLGAARLEAVSFDADISGKGSAPQIDAHFSNGAALVAGLRLSGVTGNGRIALDGRSTGNLALAGIAEGQPLTLRTSVAGDRGAWTLANSQMKLGALQVDAPRIALDKAGALDAVWTARGPLAGIYGIEAGALSAKGTLRSARGELMADTSGAVTGFRRGAVLIDAANFTASLHNGDILLDSRIRGEVGAAIDLTLKAHGASNNAKAPVWTGDAAIAGTLDHMPVATAQPITWTYGAAGWSVEGGVTGLGGRVDGKASLAANEAAADLKLDSIDLSAVTRLARTAAFVGQLSGTASFRNAAGRATGEIALDVADMNPAGITADPVKVHLTGRLADNRLATDVSGAGQGFALTASSLIRVTSSQGFDIAPDLDAPLQASVSLDGHAEQLWALFGPEGQSLRGHIIAKVAASGSLASPALQGDFTVADGAYEHGETGLKLYRIASTGQFNQRSMKIMSLSADDGANGKITGEGEIGWEKGFDGAITFKADNLHALARDDRFAIVSGEGALSLDPDAVRIKGAVTVVQARISVEQPAAASIPTLPVVQRVKFPGQVQPRPGAAAPAPTRPVLLDMKVTAPRRIVVFGRGLDTEWSTDFQVTGSINDPIVKGMATLVRGDLDLAGRRFAFDTGSIRFDGPIRTSRVDFSATRTAADIDATVHITGTPVAPKFTLESTPALPQDEILARVLFGRSASQLSALEAAQLAAGLAQLAGGQAGFDPAGLLRQATGLDRVAVGASGGAATVQAGKYLADNVYIQLGAGGAGGAGAEVEWEPRPGLSITSGAQANGDSRIGVRWKKDFGKPPAPKPSAAPAPSPAGAATPEK